MTIDAYAQSNTQRIADIDDNTSAIKTVVDAINDMVSSMSDAIEALSSSIAGIESTLTSVNSSVDEVKSSVATISADVTTIKSSITGFDAVTAGLGIINTKITSIEDRLTNIETSIVSGQSSSADSTSLQILSERVAGIALNMATINDQLEVISAELGVIRDTTSSSQTTQTISGFFEGTTTKTITNYDYKQHGKKITVDGFDRYELDMAFTCSTDVFLDTADMAPSQRTIRTAEALNTPNPNNAVQYLSRQFAASNGNAPSIDQLRTYAQINYITVDGRTLYNNNFVIGSGSNDNHYIEYDRLETFENRKLTAGMGLQFETRLYDGEFGNVTGNAEYGKLHNNATDSPFGTDVTPAAQRDYLIKNAIKDDPREDGEEEIELYTVMVNWNSYSDTTCSISIGGAASAIGADTPYSETFGATISGEGILKTYEDTLDCGGNPLTINTIRGASGDDDNLANFGTLELTVLDGNDEDNADVTYTFGPGWELDPNDDSPKTLPLTVSGHNVKISGTFPSDSLIIQLEYNSVPNAGCTTN
jgi:archaellum component FlaC